MTIWSWTIVLLCCGSPLAQPKTPILQTLVQNLLTSTPIWSKSTVPMSKSYKVPNKFLQSSHNSVYKESSIVRCAVEIIFTLRRNPKKLEKAKTPPLRQHGDSQTICK
jgi:hypothetical protein